MTKKNLPAEIGGRSPISADTLITDAERSLAARLNIDLSAPVEDLLYVAADKTNRALRLIIEAGLNFMAIKDQVGHGNFESAIEEAGIDSRRAREAMVLARGLAAMPAEHADKLLATSKSKALLLAGVDSTVMEALIGDESVDIDLISVRALRQRIADLEAATTDLTVQRDKAETQLEAVVRQHQQRDRTDGLPVVIADLRAEITALAKKSELTIESFGPIGSELAMLIGTDAAGDWVDGTVRLALSALSAQRLFLEGQIKKWMSLLPNAERLAHEPADATSYLSRQELAELGKTWPQLVAVHEHEKALREWERDQAKPRGKGRPAARPEAPKA